MERALAEDLLAGALGDNPLLPTTSELEAMLEGAELSLLSSDHEIDPKLTKLAWQLHGIASAPESLELYSVERQRQAFQVSAHILDLIGQEERPLQEILRASFAAQVGYHHSGLAPNATAVLSRLRDKVLKNAERLAAPERAALECGIVLLGLDRRTAYTFMRELKGELQALRSLLKSDDIDSTVFGALSSIQEGCWQLLTYLVYGDNGRLDIAEQHLLRALGAPAFGRGIDAKWCAAQLIRLIGPIKDSSIWSALPPTTPSAAKAALARSDPGVLTLWPPQMALLKDAAVNPLDPAVTRGFISMPTSGGKSLLAQMIVLCHLASTKGSVCYLAPTHSLCREVAGGLRERVRALRGNVYADIDLTQPMSVGTADRVDVMTPERFSYLLRASASDLLAKYSLFVLDEAHMVGDRSRGWNVEATMSILDALTRDRTDHRIFLLSAAVGNRLHFTNWIGADAEGAVSFHQDWRGPRRLTAVYTTRPDYSAEQIVDAGRGKTKRKKRVVPLEGVLHLQSRPGRPVARLSPRGAVGELHLKIDGGRESSGTTAFYKTMIPMLIALQHFGPVLVVCGMRASARSYALALAERLGPAGAECARVASLVDQRMGEGHPLASVLRAGVAMHYSALPCEVLSAIEELGRGGKLRFLVATTALTEGVNLPVRTVAIAETGGFTKAGFDEYISGSRLLNALGRAGRAAKETEGWLVLGLNEKYDEDVFKKLRASPDDNTVSSELTVSTALDEFVAAEQRVRAREDAVLEALGEAPSGFVAFVWAALEALHDETGAYPDNEGLQHLLEHTLAWRQLDAADRQRLVSIAEATSRVHALQPAARRRRWAQSGMPIATARALEDISDDLAKAYLASKKTGLERIWDAMSSTDFFDRSLALDGAPDARVWNQRSNRKAVSYSLAAVVADWRAGKSYSQIAATHFGKVNNDDYRLEQAVDLISDVVSTHIPWVAGTAWAWVDHQLEQMGEPPTESEIAALIREGVRSPAALHLLRNGLQSRRLASAVAQEHAAHTSSDAEPPGIDEWLESVSVDEWRDLFGTTPRDLLDLFEYFRTFSSNHLSLVLEGKEATAQVVPEGPLKAAVAVALHVTSDDDEYSRLGLFAGGELIARPLPHDEADLRALRRTGLPLDLQVFETENGTFLAIKLVEAQQITLPLL